MIQPLFTDSSPTPPPVSAVVLSSSGSMPSLLPAHGMRRLLVAWSNSLTQVYGDVGTFDDARASALHNQHAAAVAIASQLPAAPLVSPVSPLSAIEDAWVQYVSTTPRFLNCFGQQGWRVARVPLASLVAWQPIVDAPHASAPPLATEEDIVKALMPEPGVIHPSTGAISRDEQGTVHAVLSSADPSHDVDMSLEDEGAGGLRIRLRARPNIVFAMPLNGRLVLLNGYNRLVRLAAAGHVDAPLVLLEPGHAAAGPIADRPGFHPLPLIMNIPRPPLITDFLDSRLTIDIPKPPVDRGHDFRITHVEIPIRR